MKYAKTLFFYLNDEELKALDEEADVAGVTRSEYVRRCINETVMKSTVNINYVGLLNGEAFEGGTDDSEEGYDLELGSNSFIDGFEEGLIGAVAGEKRDLNLTVLLEHMSPALDMDCMSPNQVGMFYEHPSIYNSPCTPFGITLLLKHYIPREKLQGSNVVVIGRSAIVGRPIARLMEFEFNSTVTICHSKTKDLKFYTQNADIIIVAVGKEKLLTAELVKDGAIIVDVGINRNAEGKVCGDADYDNLLDKVYAITPVPGGVGPMTVASLVYKNGEVK